LEVLPAGTDVEMGGGSLYVRYLVLKLICADLMLLSSNFKQIPSLVKSGRLSIRTVNTAVSRILRAKFEMGLFENPYSGVPEDQFATRIHTDEAVKLARRLDRESIVLLENHNNTLPLQKSSKIAVIGPMAHGFMNVSTSL
jgi:beta-glucosidase